MGNMFFWRVVASSLLSCHTHDSSVFVWWWTHEKETSLVVTLGFFVTSRSIKGLVLGVVFCRMTIPGETNNSGWLPVSAWQWIGESQTFSLTLWSSTFYHSSAEISFGRVLHNTSTNPYFEDQTIIKDPAPNCQMEAVGLPFVELQSKNR